MYLVLNTTIIYIYRIGTYLNKYLRVILSFLHIFFNEDVLQYITITIMSLLLCSSDWLDMVMYINFVNTLQIRLTDQVSV